MKDTIRKIQKYVACTQWKESHVSAEYQDTRLFDRLGPARAYKDTVRRLRVEVINQRRVLPHTNNSIQLSLIMRECTLVYAD